MLPRGEHRAVALTPRAWPIAPGQTMDQESDRPLWRYEFLPARDDFAALVRARPKSGASTLIPCAVLAGGAWNVAESLELSRPLVALCVIAAAAIALALARAARWLRDTVAIARWTPPAGPTRVDVFGDHVAVHDDGGARFVAWEFVRETRDAGTHAMIMPATGDAIVIPLRAFENRADMAAFCRFRDAKPGIDDADDDRAPPPAALTASISLLPADNAEISARMASGRSFGLGVGALLTTICGGLASGGAGFAMAPALGLDDGLATWLACAWPGAILLTWLGARRMEAALAREWPADDPRRQPREFTIDAFGLTTRGENFETRIAWVGIEHIRDADGFLLFVTRWKEVYAAPARCFADANAYQAFVDGARTWRHAARKADHVESPS